VVSFGPGLLVRLRRPSVAPSARSLGSRLKDCDHADGTPAASYAEWTARPESSAARVARHDIVRCETPSREDLAGTMSSPARPGERCFPRAFIVGQQDGGGARSSRVRRRRVARWRLRFRDVWGARGKGFGGEHRPPSRKHRRFGSGGAFPFRNVRKPSRRLRVPMRRIERPDRRCSSREQLRLIDNDPAPASSLYVRLRLNKDYNGAMGNVAPKSKLPALNSN